MKVTPVKGTEMAESRGKTIHVSGEVHARLSAIGRFQDSYNDIIKRLLDEKESAEAESDDSGEDHNGQEESSE